MTQEKKPLIERLPGYIILGVLGVVILAAALSKLSGALFSRSEPQPSPAPVTTPLPAIAQNTSAPTETPPPVITSETTPTPTPTLTPESTPIVTPTPESKLPDTPDSTTPKLGLFVSRLTPQIAKQLNLPRDIQGVVVSDVQPSGPAADVDIQPGDVIEQINDHPVRKPEDLVEAIKLSGTRPVTLLRTRVEDGDVNSIYVQIRPRYIPDKNSNRF